MKVDVGWSISRGYLGIFSLDMRWQLWQGLWFCPQLAGPPPASCSRESRQTERRDPGLQRASSSSLHVPSEYEPNTWSLSNRRKPGGFWKNKATPALFRKSTRYTFLGKNGEVWLHKNLLISLSEGVKSRKRKNNWRKRCNKMLVTLIHRVLNN